MFYNLVSNVDDENKQGKMGILRNLIDNYESFFDPVPYKNNAKASIIYACVVFGNICMLRMLLEHSNLGINQEYDSPPRISLHQAILLKVGSLEKVQLLLKSGADPNF